MLKRLNALKNQGSLDEFKDENDKVYSIFPEFVITKCPELVKLYESHKPDNKNNCLFWKQFCDSSRKKKSRVKSVEDANELKKNRAFSLKRQEVVEKMKGGLSRDDIEDMRESMQKALESFLDKNQGIRVDVSTLISILNNVLKEIYVDENSDLSIDLAPKGSESAKRWIERMQMLFSFIDNKA